MQKILFLDAEGELLRRILIFRRIAAQPAQKHLAEAARTLSDAVIRYLRLSKIPGPFSKRRAKMGGLVRSLPITRR